MKLKLKFGNKKIICALLLISRLNHLNIPHGLQFVQALEIALISIRSVETH
jgi:hypothetical protein